MATRHSSILAWEIARTEEPCGQQSMGHKGSDMTERLNTHIPTPLFLLVTVFFITALKPGKPGTSLNPVSADTSICLRPVPATQLQKVVSSS